MLQYEIYNDAEAGSLSRLVDYGENDQENESRIVEAIHHEGA
jgi:hypothetical protein